MVKVVKSEWHQVEKVYGLVLDVDLLEEIYPELDEDELKAKLSGIEDGSVDLDQVIEDAYENDIELDWDYLDQDDWWTDRKGGYEVTFEVGDESSWYTPNTPPEPTHKCTKCKWTGQSYEADWWWPEEHTTDDFELESKKVCPYCESDLELTEHGKVEEEERKKRMAEIDAMFDEDEE